MSAQKIALIALFIVINIIGTHLALYARLPIYLDTIGTLIGSAVFGPIGGVMTGVLTALINGATGDLFSIYFMPSQITTALVSGFVYKKVKPTDFKKNMVGSINHFSTCHYCQYDHYCYIIPWSNVVGFQHVGTGIARYGH